MFINGLGFTPDGSRLLVTATLSSQLISYAIWPDGTVDSPDVVHTFEDGWPDGMAVSAAGDYWVALTAADRVDVVDAWGRRIAEIALPANRYPPTFASVVADTTNCSSPQHSARAC